MFCVKWCIISDELQSWFDFVINYTPLTRMCLNSDIGEKTDTEREIFYARGTFGKSEYLQRTTHSQCEYLSLLIWRTPHSVALAWIGRSKKGFCCCNFSIIIKNDVRKALFSQYIEVPYNVYNSVTDVVWLA